MVLPTKSSLTQDVPSFSSSLRSSQSKRDSLAAELERGVSVCFIEVLYGILWRVYECQSEQLAHHIISKWPTPVRVADHSPDPELSTAKRRQRTQAFASGLAHASLERQLSAAQSARIEIESKLREKDIVIERLENDRRYFADRENEERQERERESRTHDEDKVR